jgi:peroxiredoxin
LPTLDKLQKEWKGKGLSIVGISDEEPEAMQAFYKKSPLSYATLLDAGRKVRGYYGGGGVPYSIILDRKGRVVADALGTRSEQEFLKLLGRAGLK